MSGLDATMAGIAWGSAHRGLKVEKIENGYIVKANFREKVEKMDDWEGHHRVKEKAFVFYSVEELMLFVRSYFERDASFLQEGK